MINIPQHKGMTNRYRYRGSQTQQHIVKGLNTPPSIKPRHTLPNLQIHVYWDDAFLYRFSYKSYYTVWDLGQKFKSSILVTFFSAAQTVMTSTLIFSHFWIHVYQKGVSGYCNTEYWKESVYNTGAFRYIRLE